MVVISVGVEGRVHEVAGVLKLLRHFVIVLFRWSALELGDVVKC